MRSPVMVTSSYLSFLLLEDYNPDIDGVAHYIGESSCGMHQELKMPWMV